MAEEREADAMVAANVEKRILKLFYRSLKFRWERNMAECALRCDCDE